MSETPAPTEDGNTTKSKKEFWPLRPSRSEQQTQLDLAGRQPHTEGLGPFIQRIVSDFPAENDKACYKAKTQSEDTKQASEGDSGLTQISDHQTVNLKHL